VEYADIQLLHSALTRRSRPSLSVPRGQLAAAPEQCRGGAARARAAPRTAPTRKTVAHNTASKTTGSTTLVATLVPVRGRDIQPTGAAKHYAYGYYTTLTILGQLCPANHPEPLLYIVCKNVGNMIRPDYDPLTLVRTQHSQGRTHTDGRVAGDSRTYTHPAGHTHTPQDILTHSRTYTSRTVRYHRQVVVRWFRPGAGRRGTLEEPR